jgi:hypothetical protein
MNANYGLGIKQLSWTAVLSAIPLTLLTLLLLGTPKISAAPEGYTFQKIANMATSCTPAPGGGYFQFDFEPWSINNRGEVAFAADFTSTNVNPCGPGNGSEGEGAFLYSGGRLSQITRVGLPAPSGGTLTFGVYGFSPSTIQATWPSFSVSTHKLRWKVSRPPAYSATPT